MIVRQIHPWYLVKWAGTERPMKKATKQHDRSRKPGPAATDEVVVFASRSNDSTGVRQPDPEVKPRAKRRVFSAKFKLDTLKEADECKDQNELGALLRREGLYASHLSTWRRQRDSGELTARGGARRGPKTPEQNVLAEMVSELKSKNVQLENELARAKAVIDIQKKLSELLGTTVQGLQSTGAES
jgi:transposase-like protein